MTSANRLPSTLLDGVRSVLLQRPRASLTSAGAGTFFALILVYVLVSLAIALVDTPAPWQFDTGGVLSLLGDALLTLFAAWLLVVLADRRDLVWGAAAVLLAATIANEVMVHWPVDHLANELFDHEYPVFATLLDIAGQAWWFVVLLAFAWHLAPRRLGSILLAATLAYAVSAMSWWWLPSRPLLAFNLPDGHPVALFEQGDLPARPLDFAPEEVMFNQRSLLDAALARIRPHTPGQINLYVVAFAGDAEEDVFRNEAEYVEQLFSERFDAEGRVLVLQNNTATVTTRPLASWTNLHYALDAIARKMDPAEDILLLYLTTHGSEDHQLLVDLDPLPLDQIEPRDLAEALHTTPPLRWKVVIVNACYSGGFIDALRDDSTLVITSSRADRSSFGCGADSDITWFGKAFLADALNRTTSLTEAFEDAKKQVHEWESAEDEEPSEPQIATSPAIEAKLAEWQRQLPDRPAVPFTPASKAAVPAH